MATSRIPATIDALVAALVAAGVTTWDGPVVTGDFDAAVYIGYDGNPDGDYRAVTATQDWDGLGAKHRTEAFSITCAATALTGDDPTKTGRDTVFGLLATVETTLRANPSLGQSPPFVAEVRPVELYTEPTSDGVQSRLVFTVDIKTRI